MHIENLTFQKGTVREWCERILAKWSKMADDDLLLTVRTAHSRPNDIRVSEWDPRMWGLYRATFLKMIREATPADLTEYVWWAGCMTTRLHDVQSLSRMVLVKIGGAVFYGLLQGIREANPNPENLNEFFAKYNHPTQASGSALQADTRGEPRLEWAPLGDTTVNGISGTSSPRVPNLSHADETSSRLAAAVPPTGDAGGPSGPVTFHPSSDDLEDVQGGPIDTPDEGSPQLDGSSTGISPGPESGSRPAPQRNAGGPPTRKAEPPRGKDRKRYSSR